MRITHLLRANGLLMSGLSSRWSSALGSACRRRRSWWWRWLVGGLRAWNRWPSESPKVRQELQKGVQSQKKVFFEVLTVVESSLSFKEKLYCVQEDDYRCNDEHSLDREAAPIWPESCGPLPVERCFLHDDYVCAHNESQSENCLHSQLKSCIARCLFVLDHEQINQAWETWQSN